MFAGAYRLFQVVHAITIYLRKIEKNNMCGILGHFSTSKSDKGNFISALNSVAHRGPDFTNHVNQYYIKYPNLKDGYAPFCKHLILPN